jgi:hypothetical protein
MKGKSVALHVHALRPENTKSEKPRHRPVFRVIFDRTNLIFKREKPVDVLDNAATFIGQ